MDRTEVIQKILDKKGARSYLEIGVALATNFLPIRAWKKVAVDPNFRIAKEDKRKWLLKNPYNMLAKYHELSSDHYFATAKKSHQFDVVFIDGLHTYQQSLKDVINSLCHLKADGVIVMHDCSPPHEASAYPTDCYRYARSLNLPGWDGAWCGDVWKTICHLRSTREDLKIFVLDCDYGLGIITRGEPDHCLNLSQRHIENMTYGEFSQDRRKLLNLKDESYFFEFLETI